MPSVPAFSSFYTLTGALALVVSLALLACTVLLAPRLIAALPEDHFVAPETPPTPGVGGLLRRLGLNVLGAVFALLGLVMLFTPGPGIVFLLIGLSLTRFPGRRRLMVNLVSAPNVLDALNWIRKRHDRPPLLAPANTGSSTKNDAPSAAWLPGALLVASCYQPTPAQAQAQTQAQTQAQSQEQAPSSDAITDITADDVASQIEDTTRRLEALDAQLAANRAERQRLAERLTEAETAAAERNTRVQGLDQDIGRFESTLTELETQIAAERATIELRRQQIATTVLQSHRAEDTNPVAVLLAHEDPALADRLSVWTGYVLRAQREQIRVQQVAIERIEAAQQRALKDRNWLAHIRRKATSQRDTQRAREAESLADISTVDLRITETTRSVETLRADASRLSTLLDELRAAEQARSGYFEAGKGGWPLPVQGRIDARFGDTKSVGRLAWEGWFIRADGGGDVTAVADGEVVYSDWLRGFGMLVIVDHGDGYMTLYGGNRDVTAQPGDWVESGATIATVGDSGGQSTTGLYFEIRHDAKPVDPALWIGN